MSKRQDEVGFRGSVRVMLGLAAMGYCLCGQTPEISDTPYHSGPEIKPPRVLHKTEPQYSPAARDNHVQGSVVLEMVVDERGRATDLKVISPLGFGLDEKAIQAVLKWKFAPGTKDGKPVKVFAIVEANFKLTAGSQIDETEQQRTSFNIALAALKRSDSSSGSIESAVKSIQTLAAKGFPAAMHALGVMEVGGEHVTRNPEDGLALFRKAADRKFGPAVYEMAIRRIEGRDLEKDPEKGMTEMHDAAWLGSAKAQFYLGDLYENGDRTAHSFNQSSEYFGLCAAQGVALCQWRLGKLLLNVSDRKERDYVQAVALLQLAAEQGIPEAKQVVSTETAKLTSAQLRWVNQLKAGIVRK